MPEADPHRGVSSIGKAEPAGRFRHLDRVCGPAPEFESRREHGHATWSALEANGCAELLARPSLKFSRLDRH